MKRIFFVIALVGLCALAACKKTETAQNANGNSAPAAVAASDTAEGRAATSQANNAAPQVKHRLPTPTGHVNDYANVIDEEAKTRLENTLSNLKKRAEIEFAIATVKTTGGEDIFDYSLAVAREWAIGSKQSGDGLLLLLAVDDRKWRVQVTRSLEADLPEDFLMELGRPMAESFRQNRYSEGLTKYVAAIIERLGKVRGFNSEDA